MRSRRKGNQDKRSDLLKSGLPADGKLQEEIDELAAGSDRRELSRADTEVREVVSKATQTEIKNYLLLEQGRCPLCHSRTENFLFTIVCPSCGWFKRNIPSQGRSIVYLRTGTEIECDYVHHGRTDEFLCIRDGVVISEVMRQDVLRIDYVWAPGELEEARRLSRRLSQGICSWCERSLEETPETDHGEDYVAFGAFQERYVFCSEKCQRAFRKQFPARIHRNCYETDCSACNLCIKRYDTHGFRRSILK